MRRSKLFATVSVFAYLSMALSAATILHTVDHAIDSHLSHSHEHNPQPDADHHDNDHDHQQIFSLKDVPSVRLTTLVRLDAPVFQSTDIALNADAGMSGSANLVWLVRNSSDPPLTPQHLLSFSLTNKAPPA